MNRLNTVIETSERVKSSFRPKAPRVLIDRSFVEQPADGQDGDEYELVEGYETSEGCETAEGYEPGEGYEAVEATGETYDEDSAAHGSYGDETTDGPAADVSASPDGAQQVDATHDDAAWAVEPATTAALDEERWTPDSAAANISLDPERRRGGRRREDEALVREQAAIADADAQREIAVQLEAEWQREQAARQEAEARHEATAQREAHARQQETEARREAEAHRELATRLEAEAMREQAARREAEMRHAEAARLTEALQQELAELRQATAERDGDRTEGRAGAGRGDRGAARGRGAS